jgi:hypothetical protein
LEQDRLLSKLTVNRVLVQLSTEKKGIKMAHLFSRKLFLCGGVMLLVAAMLISPASAQSRKTYQNLVVQAFAAPDSGDFPADFAAALQTNIVKHLQDTNRFNKVTFLEKGQPVPADADLILTGKIVKFNAGSRATRYMVGFGAGATKIKADVTFTDPVANKVILEQEVHGSVAIGVLGGDSKGATNGLAKDLAGEVKKKLP